MDARLLTAGCVDDLVLLEEVGEAAVVANLEALFKKGRIYTGLGPVVISVNPFKPIDGLYSVGLRNKYQTRHRHELPPHVFAVADTALKASHAGGACSRQCILVSGESGAGKTEAAKRLLEYIAATSSSSGGGATASRSPIHEKLLGSNPLLEAFGNAKTVRNDNSSRFGKYMTVELSPSGGIVGGRVTNYLLEKPRVLTPASGDSRSFRERSFHVFYYLIAGASDAERKALRLAPAGGYAMLQRSGCATVRGLDDAREYGAMRSAMAAAMAAVGLAEETQSAILRLVSAVLWLGNVAFAASGSGEVGPRDAAAREALEHAAPLLGVDVATLTKSLTHRTISTGLGERITSPLAAEECAATRDALARALYARGFDHLVLLLNQCIAPGGPSSASIGILDIYGFESNSFEQLCINFANEKLQQCFISLTLRAEQEVYAREGIEWSPVQFFDNLVVCKLIEGARPPGVLAFADEETIMPKGTDESLLSKLEARLSGHGHFRVEKAAGGALRGDFTIVHYAGEVSYSCRGLLEKNRDTLFRDLGARPATAGAQFKAQMAALVDTISACEPHYIRCIKPNDDKAAGKFVTERVRYLGLVENVRVRRAGFAYRASFERFAGRYRVVSASTFPRSASRTMVFLRSPRDLLALEEAREQRLHVVAQMLQGGLRRFVARKRLAKLKTESQKLFNGQKRRRGSWVLQWSGDYVGAAQNATVAKLLSRHGDGGVLFASTVVKVNRAAKSQERILLVTARALYTLKPGSWAQTNRVPLAALSGLSMSTFADGFVVVSVNAAECDRDADLVLSSPQKAELVTVLKDAVSRLGRPEPLAISFADTLEFRSGKGGLLARGTECRTINFYEDTSLGSKARAAVLNADRARLRELRELQVRIPPALASNAALQLAATA
ncbi:hypothetical protein EMIHUDRAFT_457182 [Emiliania huxleyi CCMP1516]|uniref:Myosin motor domain-containing protein n=5 Tax=Emiliania huxleyi TaxID=2903 RepID=A0A0D3JV52_EMIH1|nr:hypothetical protein EMIHUDRAFT_457182 [Emiliania huxleyi CCMP1516]EOD27387.1 hypothetical protein EMIHUDRAFT_457182 [Emiliania huxleyi CCMP1516]|eukprot:XP_005779816.1 hypothetical protein EMIHUDRAFT_457182 [Emiliania huxleyi CCMP1516]